MNENFRMLFVAAAVLIDVSTGTLIKECLADADCSLGECCAFKIKFFKNTGYCLSRKRLGEVCNPYIVRGKHLMCGCKKRLTCAEVDKDKFKNPKYRCVRVPKNIPETGEPHPNQAPERKIKDDPSIKVDPLRKRSVEDEPWGVLLLKKYFKNRLERQNRELQQNAQGHKSLGDTTSGVLLLREFFKDPSQSQQKKES